MFALLLTPAKTLEDLKPVQAEHEQYLQKYIEAKLAYLEARRVSQTGVQRVQGLGDPAR